MGYSDGKFFLDVLHGYAYRYWWEGLTRNGPGVWPSNLAWYHGMQNLRG